MVNQSMEFVVVVLDKVTGEILGGIRFSPDHMLNDYDYLADWFEFYSGATFMFYPAHEVRTC
jgi:glutamate dehydrogenase/leucine dehydrogenase